MSTATDVVAGEQLVDELGELPAWGSVADVAESSAAEQRATPRQRLPLWRRSRRRHRASFVAGAPIVGFTGPNGMGKTLVAVSCIANDDLRLGRPVYSTVPITSPWGDSLPITSLRQLLELRDCTVFLDEVAVIFSSRDSMLVPREFDVFLQTLRHKGVTLRWTAPAWARADVRVREVTQVVVSCQGLGKVKVAGSFWRRPMLTLCGALDTISVAVDAAPEKVLKRRLFIPQALVGWGGYDTHADTPRIGHTATGGACVDCGGQTKRESCTVERHESLSIPTYPGQPHAARQRLTA